MTVSRTVTVTDKRLFVATPAERVLMTVVGETQVFHADRVDQIVVVSLEDDAVRPSSSWLGLL